MSKLKAVDPQTVEPTKPKFIIYGPAGVGKTWFGLAFPNVYYCDTENGANRAHYMERLKKAGGKYLGVEHGSLDFEVLIDQVKVLSTEKHSYKTVVIDSITKVFNNAVGTEAERLGDKNAFGADKKPAIAYMRRLIAALGRLDMNVIMIAHEKPEWGIDAKGERSELGKIPDCWDKVIYELDLALACVKRGTLREALVKKSRLLGFPEGDRFALDFGTFAERYGKDVIEKAAKVIVLAGADQVAEITRLCELLKVDPETRLKWFEKANCETFAEFTTEQAAKIITNLQTKLTKTP